MYKKYEDKKGHFWLKFMMFLKLYGSFCHSVLIFGLGPDFLFKAWQPKSWSLIIWYQSYVAMFDTTKFYFCLFFFPFVGLQFMEWTPVLWYFAWWVLSVLWDLVKNSHFRHLKGSSVSLTGVWWVFFSLSKIK